jgi:hypothetical protein
VPSSSFARRSCLAVLAAFALSACQVTTSVDVDVAGDGSGVVRAVVTLDAEASRNAGDLAGRLRVDDLKSAGWRIDGPVPTPDGGQEVRASKPFATPVEASVVVAQLGGESGPFQSFRVTRTRSFLKTRIRFESRVDLARGLASFSDSGLRDRLGSDLGFDAAALEARLGRPLSTVFPMRVSARLPGEAAQWSPVFGENVALLAEAERWNTVNMAAGALALVAGLALAALLVRRRPR